MRLKITHRTQYDYTAPVPYALQRIRLVPLTGDGQTVLSWRLSVDGAREELRFIDHFGNDTRLLSVTGAPRTIIIEVAGEVETQDRAGVVGAHRGFAPLWLFQPETPLTKAGAGVDALVADIAETAPEIERLHALMARILERVAYRPGATGTQTSAEEAIGQGAGVCQDHAHIFLSAARRLGFPARYVSGYLMMDGSVDQAATHAWAEAHVAQLGWVGFDVANGISPDARYVKIATGRDYRDAAPVSGIRHGEAEERLEVTVTVEQ